LRKITFIIHYGTAKIRAGISKKRPRARPWKKRASLSLSQNPSVSILSRPPFDLVFPHGTSEKCRVDQHMLAKPVFAAHFTEYLYMSPVVRTFHNPSLNTFHSKYQMDEATFQCLVPLSQLNLRDTSLMIATGLVDATRGDSQNDTASGLCLSTGVPC